MFSRTHYALHRLERCWPPLGESHSSGMTPRYNHVKVQVGGESTGDGRPSQRRPMYQSSAQLARETPKLEEKTFVSYSK